MEELDNLQFSSLSGGLEYQAKMRPEKKAILYPDLNTKATEYASLTYKQYNNIVSHLAVKIGQHLPPLLSDQSITCAILAPDSIQYLLVQYALLKLPNVVMFPISPRNSPAAIEHLLKETKTVLLLTTSQFLPLMGQIQQQQDLQSLKTLHLDNEEFQLEQLLMTKNLEDLETTDVVTRSELDKVVLILHR